MENRIKNPEKLPPQFNSWKHLYNHIISNVRCYNAMLRKEKTVFFDYMVADDFGDSCAVLSFAFDWDYLKARVYDESQNLPYLMDDEICREAYYSLEVMNNVGLNKAKDWLESVVNNERSRLINNKKQLSDGK